MTLGAEIAGTKKAMVDCRMLPSMRLTYVPARRAGDRWIGFRSI